MARSEFDEFCRSAFSFLDAEGVRYLVIGGLAVIVVGEPRTTGDADVLAYISTQEARALLSKARRAGFRLNLREEVASLSETGTATLRRGLFHLDILLASLPFEDEALRRSTARRLFGRKLRFPI